MSLEQHSFWQAVFLGHMIYNTGLFTEIFELINVLLFNFIVTKQQWDQHQQQTRIQEKCTQYFSLEWAE